MMKPMLEFNDVTVRFRRKRTALDRVTMAAEQGLVALLGPNGAGKTTFLRLAATATRPGHGCVSVLGQTITRRTPDRELSAVRKQLGYLPQDNPLMDRLPVIDFVAYVGWNRGMDLASARVAARQTVERVGLADRAEDRIRDLSGGMRQRVGLAQAMVNDPSVMILDEPTVGLDPRQRSSFRDLVAELAADRLVLVSTHLVEDVAQWRCPVLVLDEGRAVFQGQADELVTSGRQRLGSGTDIERGYFAILDHTEGYADAN